MADERENLVRRLVDAWNRRDLDAILSCCHRDVEYVNAPQAIEPGTRHGHDGVVLVMRRQWEAFEPDGRQEIVAVHEVSEDLVTEGKVTRSMPGSKRPLENRVAIRWSFLDDLVRRLEILGAGTGFGDALDAALREKPAPTSPTRADVSEESA